MQYATCKLKNAIGIVRKIIPELIAGVVILIAILLLAGCKDESGNNTTPTFTMSSNADLAGFSFFANPDQAFSVDYYVYSTTLNDLSKSLQVTPVTANAGATYVYQ